MLYLFLFQARLVRDKVRRKEKKDGKDRRVGGKEEEEMDRRTTYFLRPARPLSARWGLAWVSKRGKTPKPWSSGVIFVYKNPEI